MDRPSIKTSGTNNLDEIISKNKLKNFKKIKLRDSFRNYMILKNKNENGNNSR
jgi:hypothetical protein